MKTHLLFFIFIFFNTIVFSQTTIAFQGGEGTAADNWGFATITNAGGPTPPGIVSVLPRTGTNAIRAAGGTNIGCSGGSNCITGGSTNATGCSMHGNTVTFNSVNVSCLSGVQLSCYHRSHNCGGSGGSGFDSGESLFFEVRLNGGAWTTVGTLTGGSDLQWTYASGTVGGVANPFSYNVPAGTNTFEFRVRATINRADEVFYLDDVKLTTTTTGYSFPGTAGLWGGYVSTDWFNACNWNDRNIPTAATNVVFPSNNTGGRDIVINASTNPTCNNLTINGSGSQQIKGEGNVTKKLTINGNLTIASTDGLDFSDGTTGSADGTIEIYGNWINNGVESDFKEGNSTVKFMGTANQSISTADPAGEEAFYILDINKSSGTVTMNDDVWIDKDIEGGTNPLLTFTQGKLDLNGKTLKIWNANEQAVSRTSGGIVSEKTNNSSKVTWAIENNTGAHVFPFINAANYYIPFTFNLSAGDVNDLTVSTYPTAANNTPYPTTPQSVSNVNDAAGVNNSSNTVNRFWQIDKTGASGTASLTFTYGDNEWDASEPSDYEAQRWDTPTSLWQAALPGQVQNVGANSVTVPNVTTFSPWTLASKLSPLPIELLGFSAHYDGEKNVYLAWATATEVNNDFFSVERSTDAVNFEEICRVRGAGTSLQKKTYACVDTEPKNGISYYRLKQIDFDRTFSYSQIEPVSIGRDEEIKIYPNPNETGKLKIATGNTRASVKVFDAIGKMIIQLESAEGLTELDLGPFGTGIYIVSVVTNDKTVTTKVIYQ
jgi:hypothetical protein